MQGMWIKSYASLKNSVKTRRVARRLNITVPQVIGHLHMLWWWVMEQADTGDISHVDVWEVEETMGWNGQEGALFSALVEFKFIDDDGQSRSIHDWQEHSGAAILRREKNREAQRRFQEKRKQTQSEQNAFDDTAIITKSLDNDYISITKGLDNHVEKNRVEENKKRIEENNDSPQGRAAAGDEDAATAMRVIKAWNDQLAGYGFPEASKSTPKREKAFDARLNERRERRSLLWWQEVFRRMAASTFMRDEAKRKAGWLCFDWILKEDNLVKVCEGKYDDHEKPAQRDKSYEEAAAEYYASL